MTEFMGLAEKVSKFNQEALKHIERQTLNPFSGRFSRSPSPRPKFNKDEYGKPAAGSLTEMRGQRAFTQISREILELCEVIHDMGARRRDSDGDECIIIPFGELFAFYTKISDKVVGLLIAAKKRGFVWFEPEILFQRRDDDVLIALLKPIGEIRNIINRQISASPSPAPQAASGPEKTSPCPTPSPLTRQESNTSSKASSTENLANSDNPTPSATEESAKEVPSASSSNDENVPQQVTCPTATAESVNIPLVTLGTVEEEPHSSPEAPVVESTSILPPETPTVSEQPPSTIVSEEPTEIKQESESHEIPIPSEVEQTTSSNETSETTISTNEITVSDQTTISNEPQETLQTAPASEALAPTEENTTITEASEASGEQDSLTLKIIVEVEQTPDSSAPTEPNMTLPTAEPDQTLVSPESSAPAEEETPTSNGQVAHDGNEEDVPLTTTTIEPDTILPPCDKTDSSIPSTEKEQTPPSNDTGEKTLA